MRHVAALVCSLAAAFTVAAAATDHRQRNGGRPRDARNSGETIHIAGLEVAVWRPAPSAERRTPLVVFSHGFHGNNRQSRFLMEALAASGYLVFAPSHRDAAEGASSLRERPEARFRNPEAWTDATYDDRAEDVTRLVKTLEAMPDWKRSIDWSQVALVGHSLGGYTVLGLAGAWPRWTLPEAKAVVALSPYAAPFVNRRTLAAVRIPVMYQGGTRDIGVSPSLAKGGGAFQLTPSPAYYVEFRGAGHFAWTDLTTQSHVSIADYTVSFLDRHVRGDWRGDPARRLPDVSDLRVK